MIGCNERLTSKLINPRMPDPITNTKGTKSQPEVKVSVPFDYFAFLQLMVSSLNHSKSRVTMT